MFRKITNYIKSKFKCSLNKSLSPVMIYGYKQNGELLKDIRIGTSTTLISKENLNLSDNVFIGQYNFIEASNGMQIEEGCQITNYVSILTHSSHISIRLYGEMYRKSSDLVGYIKGKVHIGKYTFIGPHVTIMPNTIIGKGCIVSAYSFVKGEYPDFSIIGGNPAKVIGDTRDMDKELLSLHPEIKEFYKKWAD